MAIDRPRVRGVDCFPPEAQLFSGGHTLIVMHYIRPAHQPLEHGCRVGMLKGQCDVALVALASVEGPVRVAQRIAGGRLHLDHIGTQIGQQLRGERSGQEIAEVEDLEAIKRRRHRSRRDIGRGQRARPRYLEWGSGLARAAEARVLHINDIVVRRRLLVEIERAHRGGRLNRNVRRPELVEPLLPWTRLEDRLDRTAIVDIFDHSPGIFLIEPGALVAIHRGEGGGNRRRLHRLPHRVHP